MFNWTKKKVPKSIETKNVTTAKLWTVEWTSRYGEFSSETKQEFEAFPIEKDAMDFHLALIEAYKLVRHTSGTKIKLTSRSY